PWGINLASSWGAGKGGASSRTVTVNCDRFVPVGSTCAGVGGKAPGQGSTFDITVEGSGSGNNHYPNSSLLNFLVNKQWNMGERLGKAETIFDVFNLANANTIVGWKTTSTTTNINYNGVTKAIPTFHQPTSILPP